MQPRDDPWVEMEDCTIEHVTDAAILLIHQDDQFWVPKSVIQNPEDFEKGDTACLVLVKEWFARKQGLI